MDNAIDVCCAQARKSYQQDLQLRRRLRGASFEKLFQLFSNPRNTPEKVAQSLKCGVKVALKFREEYFRDIRMHLRLDPIIRRAAAYGRTYKPIDWRTLICEEKKFAVLVAQKPVHIFGQPYAMLDACPGRVRECQGFILFVNVPRYTQRYFVIPSEVMREIGAHVHKQHIQIALENRPARSRPGREPKIKIWQYEDAW